MNGRHWLTVTDWVLVPLFGAVLYSGVGPHLAGHGTDHDVWHAWAVAHTLAGVLFFAAGAVHVGFHKTWYVGLVRGMKSRSRVTLLLSALSVAVVATGFALLFWIDGAHSRTGLWHYKAGLAMGVCGIMHIATRLSRLMRSSGRR